MEFITDSKPKQICLNGFENVIKSLAYSTYVHRAFYTIPGLFPVIPAFVLRVFVLGWVFGVFWGVGMFDFFFFICLLFVFLNKLAYHRLQKHFY